MLANIIVLIGSLSNIFLLYFFKKNQLLEKISLTFLTLDIIQLSFLLYLTGGTINPFSIFLIIPSIFASNSLSIRTNILLIILIVSIRIYLKSDSFNLKCIISDVDGNKYCVRERAKLELAADLLANVTQNLIKLVDHLNKEYPDDNRTIMITKNFNPKKITET